MDYENNGTITPLFGFGQMESPATISPFLYQKQEGNLQFDDVFESLMNGNGDLSKSPIGFITSPDILQGMENVLNHNDYNQNFNDNFGLGNVMDVVESIPQQKREVPQLKLDLNQRKKKSSTLPLLPLPIQNAEWESTMLSPILPPPALPEEEEEKKEVKKVAPVVKSPPRPRKKKTVKRKVLTQKNYEANPKPKEAWGLVHSNEPFRSYLNEVKIGVKTRCEEPSYSVPATLYSSLKYELLCQVSFSGDCNTSGLLKDMPFLLGRVKVVHADNFREITKGKNDGAVLKGVIESAHTRIEDDDDEKDSCVRFVGTMKVQFNNVSYHHKKHDLRWEVHYFQPNDLVNPVLIERSGPFKVFARKPTQKKRKSRKRKRDINCFQEKLNELVRCAKKLKVNEKKKAFGLISSRLTELDPNFFQFLEK